MKRMVFCLAMLGIVGLSQCVSAEEFSADMYSTIAGQSMQGSIAVSGDNARMDIGGMVTITRVDEGVVWVLIPESRMYMEMPLDSQHLAAVGAETPDELEREYIGSEVIDGQTVEKYRIRYDLGEKQSAIISWIRPDSHIPVKTAAEDGSWQMEYRNIRQGVPADTLFEIPAGYQRLAMPMDTLQQGLGGMSGLSGLSAMSPDPDAAGFDAVDLQGFRNMQELFQGAEQAEDY